MYLIGIIFDAILFIFSLYFANFTALKLFSKWNGLKEKLLWDEHLKE